LVLTSCAKAGIASAQARTMEENCFMGLFLRLQLKSINKIIAAKSKGRVPCIFCKCAFLQPPGGLEMAEAIP
jgi:hypothetical protein